MFSGLTRIEAAELLGVSLRTIGHWERGAARPAYAAFKLLRVYRHGELVDPRWAGYRIIRGKLVTPENHELAPSDMAWLSLLVRRSEALSKLFAVRDVRSSAPRSGVRKPVPVSPDWTLHPLSIERVCTPEPPVTRLVRGRVHVSAAASGVVLKMEQRSAKALPPAGRGKAGKPANPDCVTRIGNQTPPTQPGSYQRAADRMVAADCVHPRNKLHPCSNTGKILKSAVVRANRRVGGAS